MGRNTETKHTRFDAQSSRDTQAKATLPNASDWKVQVEGILGGCDGLTMPVQK